MKRALIVTYYWPPAGGPGVQRWLNFVKHLRNFDVEPIVYIPENPHYPIIDRAFFEKVPLDIEIIKHPIKEPYGWANLFLRKKTKRISSGIITENKPSFIERAMLYVRGNYFIPDARIGWVEPSVKFLENYLSQKPVDVVITSGPPHSMHLIGLQLKKKTAIKWIADFRDPWTSIHYHRSLQLTDSSAKKHKELEADVLNSADSVIVTSPTTKKEFSKITETRIHIITNGYEIEAPIIAQPDVKFTLTHIGSLLSERNPELLWEVLAELASEHEAFSDKLEIKLVGAVSDGVIRSIEKYGLKSNANVVGYVSHSEAKQLQHNAQVLLLLEMNRPETRAIIPGKLFEYLVAKRPILAIGPEGSDMEQIISDTQAGEFFNYSEKEQLKQQLEVYFGMYLRSALDVHSGGIEQYSRRSLTEKLSEVIHRL